MRHCLTATNMGFISLPPLFPLILYVYIRIFISYQNWVGFTYLIRSYVKLYSGIDDILIQFATANNFWYENCFLIYISIFTKRILNRHVSVYFEEDLIRSTKT